MSNERGITIIALVVTIIILVMLAGVSLNLGLVSNSSIVKEVKNQTEKQQEMINGEQDKTDNVIKMYEDEWGI